MTPEAIQKAAERLVNAYEKRLLASEVLEEVEMKRDLFEVVPLKLQDTRIRDVFSQATTIAKSRVEAAEQEVGFIIDEVCGNEEGQSSGG